MRVITGMVLCLMLATGVMAADIKVPAALEGWEAWVLKGHKDFSCPGSHLKIANKRCAWPSELALSVTDAGASFSQRWVVYAESWLTLPGDERLWPTEITINGKPHPIARHQKKPAARLLPGEYTITGKLQWHKRPQHIPVPNDTGLIALSVDGATIKSPVIENGRLWLAQQRRAAKPADRDTINVDVFRRLNDTLPFTITTQLHLKVSGQDRELLLGRLLLPGMKVQSLSAPLPARIEDDGRLRIQLRPGDWVVSLVSRATTPPSSFQMQALDKDWPAQEVWSFAAQHQLRGVEWRGGTEGDPGQLDVPAGWRQLPAYLVTPDDTVTLEERYRGDAYPNPHQLTLRRELWLDFTGDGFTTRDQLEGALHKADRFSMADGYALGRLTLNGEPQLITAMADGKPGVEIPAGQLQLEAVSRFPRDYTGDSEFMSASGWQQNVTTVSADLNLPPGWKLLHATGVDHVASSWLGRWSLWDLFLCVVIAGAAARVLGLPWGLLAGLTLALTYQEQSSPVVLWINAILAIGLLRQLPDNTFSKLLRYYQLLSVLALVLVVLGFSVDQIRKGIYPQLERNVAIHGAERYADRRQIHREAELPAQFDAESSMADMVMSPKASKIQAYSRPQRKKYDPNARIQTGPGLPNWNWSRISLSWSGPVATEQALDLYLLPPGVTRWWRFISVVLVALWLFSVIRETLSSSLPKWRGLEGKSLGKNAGSAAAILILTPFLLFNTPDSMADFPPEFLLKELEQQLIAPPECNPNCASVQRVEVYINKQQLRIDLGLDVLTHLELALPSGNWSQETVVHNGKPASALSRNPRGQLLIALPTGTHRIQLIGRVNGEATSVVFPMPAHNVTVRATGWQVSGLLDGRVPGGTLQLNREQSKDAERNRESQLLPNPIDPFVTVHRRLELGLDWRIFTTVSRVAPARGAINVTIPLLEGESVLTAGVEIVDGNAVVSMPANKKQQSWSSSLKQREQLTLTAPPSHGLMAERWYLNHTSTWHVETQGPNPVKSLQAGAPHWQPWPGEQLVINAERPSPIDGPTQTVEQLLLQHRPGDRISESELTLKVRASRGGHYPLSLPPGAELQSVKLDGKPQTLHLEEGQLQLPLHPGTVNANIIWRTPQEGKLVLETPALTMSSPATNIDLRLKLPRDRWPLFVAGPDIGPALLFWGVLVVIILVSLALGWSVKKFNMDIPVRSHQWLLLGLGVSTVSVVGGVLIVLWFAALAGRAHMKEDALRWQFNWSQVLLVLLTIAALGSLVATIPASLLSTPDMQVVGNNSSNWLYSWYQDHSDNQLPVGWVFSLPIAVYRAVMLAWSLWLMLALLDWVKWGWACFSTNGLWKRKSLVAKS